MKKLLIYIPTYNRLDKLKFCVDRLLQELIGFEDLVKVHISDNCSTDGTYNYVKSINHPSFNFNHNTSNVGLARNLCFAFDLSSEAEYTWIVGDDDFLLSGALQKLLSTISANPNIDFFFLNTICYNIANKRDIVKKLEINAFIPLQELGQPKSKFNFDFKCELRDLFNPQIDEVFIGSLMCYVWRSKLVKNVIDDEDLSFDFSKPKSCYPHTYNFLHCLKPSSPSLHLSYLVTANFWHGGGDWGDKGIDLVVTQGLGIVLYEAIRLGYVPEANHVSYFEHYMSIATPAYKRLLEDSEDGFDNNLVDFHSQLAEMLLRYRVAAPDKPQKNIWSRLLDLSPRKMYKIFGKILKQLRIIISRRIDG